MREQSQHSVLISLYRAFYKLRNERLKVSVVIKHTYPDVRFILKTTNLTERESFALVFGQ